MGSIMQDQFERLVAEAEAQQMSGWDWSHVEGRYIETEPPWNSLSWIWGLGAESC
jgi:hypothetical protein